MTIKIFDNRKEVELHHNTIHFKTGSASANSKKKLNDLQSRVLPTITKEYLKNASCMESLNELETVHSELTDLYLGQAKLQKLKQHLSQLN